MIFRLDFTNTPVNSELSKHENVPAFETSGATAPRGCLAFFEFCQSFVFQNSLTTEAPPHG